ncbi:hypothetical protein QRD02_05595 [Aequorivita sp. SDUM287046]|uniref:Uncharacterized protein n=1 Tax=Aequorivita aurantiaca TaxID=3053356 RepID=A0ABT8DLC1_9FLAO|nr:hypothetical protein [Aequorivita aurantiaca]MDN3723847.1 hypothetical protein [Aequorivita aurantiaca]
MSIKFNPDDTQVNVFSLKSDSLTRSGGDIKSSDELSGVEIRLSRVLIINNGTPKIFPFPGLAQFYLLIIVVSDVDEGHQTIDLKGFPKVDDGEELPVDRTLFYFKKTKKSQKTPGQIHVWISVIKSKENLRDVGNILAEVRKDGEYNSWMSKIKDALSITNPAMQVVDGITKLADIAGKYMGKVEDKAMISWQQSFTDISGDLDALGKHPKDMKNDKVSLGLTLIVRDKAREEQVLKSQQNIEVIENLNLDIE